MKRAQVDDVEIEYEVRGHGEPVLLIPLSVIIDGLAHPLFGQPELAGNYRLIHYHRRGWTGSSRGEGPPSVARQAADAVALLGHLEIDRVHVAGHSYGGVIALQLAVGAPELVHSVALLEPALRAGPKARAHLERTIGPAREHYQSGDKRGFRHSVYRRGVWLGVGVSRRARAPRSDRAGGRRRRHLLRGTAGAHAVAVRA